MIAVVAGGTISASTVSLADQAGAAATTVTHSRTATLKHKELARAVRRDCTRTRRWQHQQKRVRARFEKRLHRLKTWEATAIAVGHAPRVAALKRDLVHVRALKSAGPDVQDQPPRKRKGAKRLGPACTAVARAVQAERKTAKATKANRVESQGEGEGRQARQGQGGRRGQGSGKGSGGSQGGRSKGGHGRAGATTTPATTTPTTTTPTTSSTPPTTLPVRRPSVDGPVTTSTTPATTTTPG